jgi:putative Mg2+ transporter-C (MgtC) family protein
VALTSCGFVQSSENLLVHSPDGMVAWSRASASSTEAPSSSKGNSVHGTAAAANLWATGAIGVSVGLDSFDVAIAVSDFTFLTPRVLTLVKEDNEAGSIKSD